MSDDPAARVPENLRIAVLRLHGTVHEYRKRLPVGDFDPGTLAKLDELRNLVVHSTKRSTPLITGNYDAYLESMIRGCTNFSPLRQVKSPVPPKEASFLLNLFLRKADREVLPADLEEEFTTSILPKYGARRARFWFWMQTARTIATRNVVCRWLLVGGLVRIGEWFLRKIGS